VIQPPASVRRLVYFGTPAIAVPPLEALHDAGYDIALVVTNEDRRRGRGKDLVPTPVKRAAVERGLPVAHGVGDVWAVHEQKPIDLGVVVAFGHLIPAAMLDSIAMVNIHFSKLPRWRGAAPLERAILAGDSMTAVSLMALEETLDTGGIYRELDVPIAPTTTLDELREVMVTDASAMLVDALDAGLGDARPQTGEATWAHKLTADDRRIDWSGSAEQIRRVVNIGRAHTTFRDRRFVIHAVAPIAAADVATPLGGGQLFNAEVGPVVGTGDGVLQLLTVQPEGKAAVDASAWANGARLGPDDVLGR